MKKAIRYIFVLWLLATIVFAQNYFPPYGEWERKQPAAVGMSKSVKLWARQNLVVI